MAYLEAYVVWNGTLDEERTFSDKAAAQLMYPSSPYDRWARRIIRDAHKAGDKAQVYSIYHAHPQDGEECCCAQYLTDHHPDYSTEE